MTQRHPKRKLGGGRFARLPLSALSSPAVTTLSHAQFRVLVLLVAQFNGYNNGSLGITRRQAAQQGVGSDHTLYGALKALELRGLIDQTYHASRVPPRPAMYAITWESLDDTNWSRSTRVASHTYRAWQAPPKVPRGRQPQLSVVRTAK